MDRTDLFLYNAATGSWTEAFSDGVGSFTYASGSWDPGWTVAMTDFNEDGRGDIMLSRPDGTWVQATNTGRDLHLRRQATGAPAGRSTRTSLEMLGSGRPRNVAEPDDVATSPADWP